MTATPSSRFAAARRRVLDTERDRRLPPLRTLATGPPALAVDLAAAFTERLQPDEIIDIWGDETEHAAVVLSDAPGAKRRRLVRWWDIAAAVPNPVVLTAARSMTKLRGTWLLATDTGAPHQAWADGSVWDWRVGLVLSEKERTRWVQELLGGAHSNVAQALIDSAGTSPAQLRGTCRAVRLVVDGQPTTDDIAALVPRDAGRDYVDSLLRSDRRGCAAAAPQVQDARYALNVIQWRLMDLWQLSELRPGPAQRPAREVVEATGLPRWVVDELTPLARFYPRARVGDCLEALAVAWTGLDAAPTHGTGVLKVLAGLWCSGR